jgi:phosphoglycerate dehydrogenase-like enzyme
MRVVGIRRTPNPEVAREFGVGTVMSPAQLHDFLRQSDAVVLACPLTPETYGMIGEKELMTMKRTSLLVNVARAFLVQEEPLYKALTQGWIAGFGSEVWWTYHTFAPAPSHTGVHKLPNVVAANDRALWNPEGFREFTKSAFENVDEFASGRRPRYIIDLDRLY